MKQTYEFVLWAQRFLFEQEILKDYTELEIWSDGWPKHFKVWNTLYGLFELGKELINLTIN